MSYYIWSFLLLISYVKKMFEMCGRSKLELNSNYMSTCLFDFFIKYYQFTTRSEKYSITWISSYRNGLIL